MQRYPASDQVYFEVEPRTPYEHAEHVEASRIEFAQDVISKLIRVGIGLLAVIVLLIAGLITMALQSDIIPFLIEVDVKGQSRLVGKVNEMKWSLNRTIETDQVHRWLKALRQVSSDRKVMTNQFAYLRLHTTPVMNMKLDRSFEKKGYFDLFGQNQRTVRILSTTAVKGIEHAYRVHWAEDLEDMDGGLIQTKEYLAEVHLTIKVPESEADVQANAFGAFVSYFDMDGVSSK